MSEKSDKIFIWLGKLSLVLGIIYAIIQICFSLFFFKWSTYICAMFPYIYTIYTF